MASGQKKKWVDKMVFRLGLRRWAQAARASHRMELSELREHRTRAVACAPS